MMRTVICMALLLALAAGYGWEEWQMINSIISPKLTWRAGTDNSAVGHGRYVGACRDPELSSRPRYTPPNITQDIPQSFDARQKWPNCTSIASHKEQFFSSSSWALASAAVMSDRLCISSGGQTKLNLSAEYLLTCCFDCGDGCDDGVPYLAWKFYQSQGLVTGGDKDSNEGCLPYLSSDEHKCTDKCTNPDYEIPFSEDKHYGSSPYYLVQNVTAIQHEIMTNGPVVATFSVYSDFVTYTTGVYQHLEGYLVGYQAVRVIGWGRVNGLDYWLAFNSWDTKWGENGLFKIIRGTNEVGFEEQVLIGA